MADFVLDLRGLAEHAHTRAYYTLRELRPGQVFEVLLDQEPKLLMDAVSLQLRHAIHWQVRENGPPLWRLSVQRREDVAPVNLVDLLERDHLRIDRLFASALHKVNAGDLEGAAPDFRAYVDGLRRHVEVENELIVPLLDLPRNPNGQDPTSIMLREHDEILEQTTMLEHEFSEGVDEAWAVAPFFALISGALAKHEGREEQNLFPHWSRALKERPDEASELLRRAQALLETTGPTDPAA
ncbi:MULTISPECIES: hemerythrin domain-containing protein [unclassified Thioalkalivibrio]|uniref:hemerythrin domain-containing protein n=1 Tax=unclassified Thioalkalivibrio TaxID=2621013 RepID=UPI0003767E66|nr:MULTISPECIES: hemerythrin domain-containing protein [unclassified Thioalkalivibrio]